MKIVPRNTLATTDKTLSGQSERYIKATRQNKSENKQVDSTENKIIFSPKSSENSLSKSAKTINNTIGKLQVAIKNIDYISEITKALRDIQSISPAKVKEIQKNITQTIDNANFRGENVFKQPYGELAQNIKFEADKIKPIEFNNTKTILDFKKNLATQKQYAKETISFLEKKLQGSLDKISDKQGISGKNFDMFDRSAIQSEQFRNAHNTQGLTRESLARLLG